MLIWLYFLIMNEFDHAFIEVEWLNFHAFESVIFHMINGLNGCFSELNDVALYVFIDLLFDIDCIIHVLLILEISFLASRLVLTYLLISRLLF